jgi:hypothetical protein
MPAARQPSAPQAPAPQPPAAAVPSTPWQPNILPPPQPQLAAALGRLQPQRNGSYQLTVQLHPAELGTVQVQAHVDQGTLTVTVACADHAARQAVQTALPQLNAQLHSAGFGALDVNVGGQSQHQHAAHAAPPRQPHAGADPRPAVRAAPPPAPTTRRPASDLELDRWL